MNAPMFSDFPWYAHLLACLLIAAYVGVLFWLSVFAVSLLERILKAMLTNSTTDEG